MYLSWISVIVHTHQTHDNFITRMVSKRATNKVQNNRSVLFLAAVHSVNKLNAKRDEIAAIGSNVPCHTDAIDPIEQIRSSMCSSYLLPIAVKTYSVFCCCWISQRFVHSLELNRNFTKTYSTYCTYNNILDVSLCVSIKHVKSLAYCHLICLGTHWTVNKLKKVCGKCFR